MLADNNRLWPPRGCSIIVVQRGEEGAGERAFRSGDSEFQYEFRTARVSRFFDLNAWVWGILLFSSSQFISSLNDHFPSTFALTALFSVFSFQSSRIQSRITASRVKSTLIAGICPFAEAWQSGDIPLKSLLINTVWFHSRRSDTISVWPDMQAYMSGVWPLMSWLSGCALFSKRLLAAAMCPPAAAQESGVRPDTSWESGSAQCSNRASTPKTEPSAAAKDRGVLQLMSARSTLYGVYSIEAQRRASSLFSAAIEMTVRLPLSRLISSMIRVLANLEFDNKECDRTVLIIAKHGHGCAFSWFL